MSVNKLDDLFPGVAPYIANCPDGMVRTAIRWSWREFCALSMCWRELANPIPFVENQREYRVSLAGVDADILAIRSVRVLNAEGDVMLTYRNDDFDTFFSRSGEPHLRIRFSPQAQHAEQRRMQPLCVLLPSALDHGFESIGLIRGYADAIQSGAKMHLYNMPRRPWSDRESGDVERRQFMRRVVEAITEWTRQEQELIRV